METIEEMGQSTGAAAEVIAGPRYRPHPQIEKANPQISKQATMLKDLFEKISSIPLQTLIFGGGGVAMLFNIGYFLIVGPSLMNAFSIQEHLLFALSGAAVVSAFISIFFNVVN